MIFGVRARQRKRGFTVSVKGIGGSRPCFAIADIEKTARSLIDEFEVDGTPSHRLVLVRRMALTDFRDQQVAGVDAPHVADLNALIRELSMRGPAPVPLAAPYHGGSNSRVLTLLRDPGPKADATKGSGFLCIQNDDPSAESQTLQFAVGGIDPADVTPWNSYPWYVNRAPTPDELRAGADALAAVLGVLDRVSVIMLQGVHAKEGWRIFSGRHQELIEARNLSVVWTYHPSPQAMFHPDPSVRSTRYVHRMRTAAEVAGLLRGEIQLSSRPYARITEQPPIPPGQLQTIWGS